MESGNKSMKRGITVVVKTSLTFVYWVLKINIIINDTAMIFAQHNVYSLEWQK